MANHERKSTRPLSWFSGSLFHSPKTVGRLRGGLPKESSSSTVAQSTISGPILTSTTNANVARTQGVRCGELSNNDFAQSTWDPRRGWVSDHRRLPNETTSSAKALELEELIDGAMQEMKEEDHGGIQITATFRASFTRVDTSENRKHRRKGSKVMGGSTAFFRWKGALAERLKGARSSEKFVRLEDDNLTSPIDERVARHRAAGLNLGKEKIQTLTGHGNIKRKPVPVSGNLSHGSCVNGRADISLKSGTETAADRKGLGVGLARSDVSFGLGLGDMESSFLRAVDQLDMERSPSVQECQGERSSLQVDGNNPMERGAHTGNLINFSQPSPSKIATTTRRKSITNMTSPNQRNPMSRGLYQNGPDAETVNTQAGPGPRSSLAKTAAPSGSSADLGFPSRVSPGKARNLIPHWQANLNCKGSVDPLRCHPKVMEFAEPPADTRNTCPKTPGTFTPLIKIDGHENNDLDDLDDAPIFCPSSGDLSQYARLTPSPARTATTLNEGLSPGNLLEKTRKLAINETPTRPTARSPSSVPERPHLLYEVAVDIADHLTRVEKKQYRTVQTDKAAGGGEAPVEKKQHRTVQKNNIAGGGEAHDENEQRVTIQDDKTAGFGQPSAKNKEQGLGGLEVSTGDNSQGRKESVDDDELQHELSPYRVGGSNRIVAWR